MKKRLTRLARLLAKRMRAAVVAPTAGSRTRCRGQGDVTRPNRERWKTAVEEMVANVGTMSWRALFEQLDCRTLLTPRLTGADVCRTLCAASAATVILSERQADPLSLEGIDPSCWGLPH
jgi:hypothetical protein